MEWAERKGEEGKEYKLPTNELLLKVVMGDINVEDEEEVEVALWAMDELYPTIFGIANFGPKIRYYALMHKVRIAHNPDYRLFTPSNMAWIVLLVDNSRTKWEAVAALQKGDRKTAVPKKPTKKQMDSNANNVGDMIYHAAKYTNPAQGQVKYSSWSNEGMAQFKDWQDKIEKHWKEHKTEVVKVNKALLEKLRKKKLSAAELAATDSTTNHKNRKRKFAGGVPEDKKPDIVGTCCFDLKNVASVFSDDDSVDHGGGADADNDAAEEM